MAKTKQKDEAELATEYQEKMAQAHIHARDIVAEKFGIGPTADNVDDMYDYLFAEECLDLDNVLDTDATEAAKVKLDKCRAWAMEVYGLDNLDNTLRAYYRGFVQEDEFEEDDE